MIGTESFSGDEGGPPSAGRGQQLFANSTGDLFFDSGFVNRADDSFQGLYDSLDITTTAVDNLDTALTGNTLVNSMNEAALITGRWDRILEDAVITLDTVTPEISDLDALLAQMTATITDTAAAA